MAGIYIHIPFCRQACHYCNFHFSVSDRSISDMVLAIRKEMTIRLQQQPDIRVDTIYLGGGTPSMLDAAHLQLLLDTLYKFCFRRVNVTNEIEMMYGLLK